MVTSIREQFIKDFSEDIAQRLESAAESHKNGVHDDKGRDPFKWVLCICLGHQCVERYPECHGLDGLDVGKFKQWCKEKGELHTHDGDVDYLALMCGMYNEYMPGEER